MTTTNARELERLKKALKREKNPAKRLRVQMIVMRANGMTQEKIAEVTGKSRSTVNRAVMKYERGGLAALSPRPVGGRIHENLSVEEEKLLLDSFAQAAGAGELLNIHDMQAAYEKMIGHPTSKSTVYGMLDRHGWRKLMPRTHHPDGDVEAQKRFKKKTFPRL